MPTIGSIEKKIERVEGFRVNVLYPDGRNIRSDQEDFRHNYNYERAANGDMTVAQWRDVRFRKVFPGFGVEVLYGDGQVANGNAKLSSVRDSY
jgi:hypothetical protein